VEVARRFRGTRRLIDLMMEALGKYMSMESHGGMILTGDMRRTRSKDPVAVPTCPPRVPQGLTRVPTRASEVRVLRLTAWATARPNVYISACGFNDVYLNTVSDLKTKCPKSVNLAVSFPAVNSLIIEFIF
jgi:hypothetical protein